MILDEIIRPRIPPVNRYRVPHSQFIESHDPWFLHFETSYVTDADPYINPRANRINDNGSPSIEDEKGINRYKMNSPKLSRGDYAHRISTDQSLIASDIRKYISSHHVNPPRKS